MCMCVCVCVFLCAHEYMHACVCVFLCDITSSNKDSYICFRFWMWRRLSHILSLCSSLWICLWNKCAYFTWSFMVLKSYALKNKNKNISNLSCQVFYKITWKRCNNSYTTPNLKSQEYMVTGECARGAVDHLTTLT